MDKINNRKVRMAPALQTQHNPRMSEDTYDALFEEAHDLAYRSFEDTTDDHIECIYFPLVVNHPWGLGSSGAVTVH